MCCFLFFIYFLFFQTGYKLVFYFLLFSFFLFFFFFFFFFFQCMTFNWANLCEFVLCLQHWLVGSGSYHPTLTPPPPPPTPTPSANGGWTRPCILQPQQTHLHHWASLECCEDKHEWDAKDDHVEKSPVSAPHTWFIGITWRHCVDVPGWNFCVNRRIALLVHFTACHWRHFALEWSCAWSCDHVHSTEHWVGSRLSLPFWCTCKVCLIGARARRWGWVLGTPGVGVSKAPFVNFSVSKILDPAKYLLDSLHHIHIWQVSPQLSCGDTYQIWTWYLIPNMYFGDVEKLGK